MWIVLSVIFAVAGVWLARRLYQMNLLFRRLADGAERRQAFLIEEPESKLPGGRQMRRLQAAVNALIDDSKKETQHDRGLFHQIEVTMGSLREGVLVVDEDNRIRVANLAVQRFFGANIPLVNRRLESVIQSAELLEYVRAVKASGRIDARVIEVGREDGDYWFEVNGALLPRDGDGARMAIFALHDITQLKRLERMRTDFVANVSHELRTPVTIIKGFTDTLVDEEGILTAEERSRFLERIQRNVVRLHLLLEDLLMLTRLESREEKLNQEYMSLNRLVEEVVENFRGRVGEAVVLDLDLCDEDPVLSIDPLRLTQVLENFLENAVRHAKGMTRLLVCTKIVGQQVRCIVEDNGCGIPSRHLPHLFERFYRVDRGRSREAGGTGLGLSISKHIVQQHGGSVFVESQPGKGTRIGFGLPIPSENAEG